MKRAKPLFIAILVLSLTGMASSLATAENFVDIYGGVAIPADENVTVHGSQGGVTLKTTELVSFDEAFTVGGRVGFWYTEANPSMDYIGFALDVSYFKTEAADDFGTDIDVVPITGLIMLRHPGDTFQPYLGIGGGLFISHIKQEVDLSVFGAGTKTASDTSLDPGFDARAGLGIKVHKNITVFGEGRYTYFEAKYKDTVSDVRVKVETDSNVFYFLGGISFRF
jgi:opacity protein-like surface antigen